ncbi:hypothetical protein EDD28_0370 [Salana multivorans]|uniref:Uncharacterized protein n=1 Tax=Salana multivorans TaxID=120377 RepID=A0A3N2D831_9MICO|nr:hypothetical protein [Salana multivorans]ROR95808.1 hypothetical protein EDD28_0370 [Salana multivorans]
MSETDDGLVPVFMPPLVVLLQAAETAKGLPLSRDEVLAIRDDGVCVMLRRSAARAMSEARGYADLDPGACWEQWQVRRAGGPGETA